MASKPTKKYGLNPIEIRGLSGEDLKRTYQHLRKQALNRAQKLRYAGYEDYTIANPNFPSLRTIDKNVDPEASYRAALREVSRYLNDERSNVGYLKKQEAALEKSLAKSHYDIPKSQLREFGNFMEGLRNYYGKYSYPSDAAATVFEQGTKRRMSAKTIQREFGKYLKNREKAAQLADTIRNIDPGKTKKGKDRRLTSTMLREAFNDLWGDSED